MTYLTQDRIATNPAMLARVAQAVASEGPQFTPNPDSWAHNFRRQWAAAPGWDAAWESALASGVEDPGVDEAVITDGMILSQIQTMGPPEED